MRITYHKQYVSADQYLGYSSTLSGLFMVLRISVSLLNAVVPELMETFL